MADVPVTESDEVTIADAGGVNKMTVNSDGSTNNRTQDGSGNSLTSQVNGSQRALDVGIDVAGVQVDPRQIRALTNSDVVKAQLQDNAGTAVTLGQKTMASSLPVVVASDQKPAVPNADYLTKFAADGQTFAFAGTINLATGSADNEMFLLKNPTGSGKTFYLTLFHAGIAVANVLGTFRVFYDPTLTSNGTSQTARNTLIGSATASVSNIFTLPVATVSGIQITNAVVGQNSTSIDVLGNLDTIVIPAGHALMFTGAPASNNRNAEATFQWVEA